MEQKDSKIFNNKTTEAVTRFCDLNNIENIDEFMYKCFQEGFNIRKYGLLGKTVNEGEKDLKTGIVGEKQVEIEVIREIRVEVPIEIIKEVIVEKETSDNKLKPKLDALQNTVQKLKLDNIEKDKLIKEYEKTIQDIQKFNEGTKAMYLKGSNLDDKLYNK